MAGQPHVQVRTGRRALKITYQKPTRLLLPAGDDDGGEHL